MFLKALLTTLALCLTSAAYAGTQYGVVCNTPFAAADYLLQRKGDTLRDRVQDAKKVSSPSSWCIAGYVKESRIRDATRDVHYAAEVLMTPYFTQGFPERGNTIGHLLWNIALFTLPSEEVKAFQYDSEVNGQRRFYLRYDG